MGFSIVMLLLAALIRNLGTGTYEREGLERFIFIKDIYFILFQFDLRKKFKGLVINIYFIIYF
ncbi:MAG: hypothetical protein DMG62_24190 [Acidobacteria bacterium]|nr:MAG: hypothetical protein DMG62_24190 [Acidobacteriota bacterium]